MSFLSPEVCKQRQEIHLSRMLSREFTHVEGIFFLNPEMESSVHKLRVGEWKRIRRGVWGPQLCSASL